MKPVRRILSIFLAFVLLFCGTASGAQPNAFQWDKSKDALLAGLWEADIRTIRMALELRLITCVELTEYYLERIEVYNETYNCFITLCDNALEQAALRDAAMADGTARGSLFGIPLVVKDNMDYAGYHTTSGHSKSVSRIARSNALVVENILAEGAVIIGKANMSTDAQNARSSTSDAVGQTKNAYNSLLASGGSSGGSAAATALNFAVAGLGTDTNSSLRYPAALNGCISLRTTYGTLSMKGIDWLDYYRDVPGVITRTVMDQAIILDALSGGESSYAENLNGEVLSGLRIGVLQELSYPVSGYRNGENFDDEIEAAFANAIKELESCGVEIVEVSIPNIFNLAEATFPDSAAYLKKNLYRAVEKAMEESQVSALIFPSYLHTPHRSGRDANGKYWDVFSQSYINNTRLLSPCASLPEITVPIGHHSLGAGIGMEIAALKNQEQLLLDIAYAYTTRYEHRRAPSNAPDLYDSHYRGTLSELLSDYCVQQVFYTASTALPQKEVPPQESETVEASPPEETQPLPPVEDVPAPVKRDPSPPFVLHILLCLFVAYFVYQSYSHKRRRRARAKRSSVGSSQEK